MWGVTCTAVNHAHLNGLATAEEEVVELMYHGLDLSRFVRPERVWNDHDGTDSEHPVELLSVGRAVEKKGYGDLLDALAKLDSKLHWQFTHIGGGPYLDRLKAQAEQLGIGAKINWLGARAQAEVVDAYARSDMFVLASKIASDGDRDGLPNVIVEAQSQALPVVATNVSAIPELITDNVNGLLVEPGDVDALAQALAQLITDPKQRERLGEAGGDVVHQSFSMERGLDKLMSRITETVSARARL